MPEISNNIILNNVHIYSLNLSNNETNFQVFDILHHTSLKQAKLYPDYSYLYKNMKPFQ